MYPRARSLSVELRRAVGPAPRYQLAFTKPGTSPRIAASVTSATAAVRGNAGQHSHAAAMGGRRMLCQTLNAEFARKGIHVAHVLVDGMVDAPDTLGKMLGAELFQELRGKRGGEQDGLMLPAQMAETYYHVAHQHRSAWTHELDLRAYSDLAWWNH